jgi:class 3 adenylate cyclase
MERRLAAILVADMVGYSRLMEIDEAGTLARLKTHRLELIDPAIAKNNRVQSSRRLEREAGRNVEVMWLR